MTYTTTEPKQCSCVAPSSTLRGGRWICDECDRDTDLYAPDENEEDWA